MPRDKNILVFIKPHFGSRTTAFQQFLALRLPLMAIALSIKAVKQQSFT